MNFQKLTLGLVLCLLTSVSFAAWYSPYTIRNETKEHIRIVIHNRDANKGYFVTLKPHSRFRCDQASCDRDYPAMVTCDDEGTARACRLRGEVTIPGCGHMYLVTHQTLFIRESNGRLYCGGRLV